MPTSLDPAADPKAECKRLEAVAKHAEASKARLMAVLDNAQRDRQRLRETIRDVVEACEPLDDFGTGDIEAKLMAIPEKLRVREAEFLAAEHVTTPEEATAIVQTIAESIKTAREDGRREGAREERKRIAIDLEAKAPVDALIAPLRNENDRLHAEVERLQEAARLGERFQPLADAEKKALEAQVERLARELESASSTFWDAVSTLTPPEGVHRGGLVLTAQEAPQEARQEPPPRRFALAAGESLRYSHTVVSWLATASRKPPVTYTTFNRLYGLRDNEGTIHLLEPQTLEMKRFFPECFPQSPIWEMWTNRVLAPLLASDATRAMLADMISDPGGNLHAALRRFDDLWKIRARQERRFAEQS